MKSAQKLSRSAKDALERAQDNNTTALLSQVHMLGMMVLKLEARVELRDAKLLSLKRRLRTSGDGGSVACSVGKW